ncbi:Dna2/Cas4 domain-containing protein [Candidatus Woesearchaeota archaeon]|nr:MAG: Dna2/Cas4 domain-containing protein [Candidatus Woesearchaeota archaeon]
MTVCAKSAMALLSVSALSSFVQCPRQFFVQYIVGEEVRVNAAMAMGLVKHKFHELVSLREEEFVLQLKAGEDVHSALAQKYGLLAREAVVKYVNSLRAVNVAVQDALARTIPLVQREAEEKARVLAPLIEKGFLGEELWISLVPKVRTEYAVQSKKLGIKGRIDRLELYGSRLLPVELKSGRCPGEGVFEHHRIQAASYALLLEDVFGTHVPEAQVHYVDHAERRSVVMNPFTREWVVDVAAKVTGLKESREVPKGCGQEYCEACKKLSDPLFLAKIRAKQQ